MGVDTNVTQRIIDINAQISALQEERDALSHQIASDDQSKPLLLSAGCNYLTRGGKAAISVERTKVEGAKIFKFIGEVEGRYVVWTEHGRASLSRLTDWDIVSQHN